ncbi:Fe(3+)-hydroxamate ABC transporter permease FhuB [Marinobacterium rhizophilum]|uniref:Fe(3+)-hydroxamate ABC transporter permease FhuB n=1 Tax=Marinobacterium rhizophilum TaxID=420402 RepID=UPI00037E4A56|nr:Fe(3+)-hydroxamate ABC transporter permease FhuB [Marinobacterium rhizophilum]
MIRRYCITAALLALMALLHLQLETDLSLGSQGALLLGQPPASFADFQYHFASLPRLVLALLIGASMGLIGSLLQQLLQNALVSPMTLGATSGAWFGLLVATIAWPAFAAEHGEWAAILGAALAVLLVMTIAGRHGLRGLPVVLAGMAVNLLFGALAFGLVLLHDQYARDVFIWGSGNLAQTDWHWVQWLAPRLLPILLLLLIAPRPLTLLRLGDGGARGRGLSLLPVMVILLVLVLWLTAVSITAAGLIGFIGLLTPNLARMLGCRSARDELCYSLLLGALLLLATDAIALAFSQWSANLVPTGAAAALIGAPALIWLSRHRLAAGDQEVSRMPAGRLELPRRIWLLIALALLIAVLASVALGPAAAGWHLQWPDALVWSLRWPRILAAAAAGLGLAIAGVMLQRLIRNPLASPDILGLSAGATLALVIAAMVFGGSIRAAGPLIAFAGSLTILLLLLLLGRRHRYAPGIMALMGISLAALLDAVLRFTLATSSEDAVALIGWLSGSTYRVSESEALLLSVGVLITGALSLACQRALTLISISEGIAAGRGLNLARSRILLLTLVSLICALVTSVMGPVAFVGLLAPHMATLLGARKALPQLLLAAVLGLLLMLLSDWLGRVIIYPMQIPAGLIASIIGGSYFVWLLARRRLA